MHAQPTSASEQRRIELASSSGMYFFKLPWLAGIAAAYSSLSVLIAAFIIPLAGIAAAVSIVFFYLVYAAIGYGAFVAVARMRPDFAVGRVVAIHRSVLNTLWFGGIALQSLLALMMHGFKGPSALGLIPLVVCAGLCAKFIAGITRSLTATQPPSAENVQHSAFDDSAVQAMDYARAAAGARGEHQVDPIYLLLGVLVDYNSSAARMLRARALDYHDVQKIIDVHAPPPAPTVSTIESPPFSPRAANVLANATKIAQKAARKAGNDDIFFDLLNVEESQTLLTSLGLNIDELRMLRK